MVSNQPGHNVRRTLELLLMNACKMDVHDVDLDTLSNIHHSGVGIEYLREQLQLLTATVSFDENK